MQGGKYGSFLFLVCMAITAAMAAAEGDDVHLSTSSKLLTDLAGLGTTGYGGGATAYGGGFGQRGAPGFDLLDPLGFAKHTKDIVQAAIKFPKPKDYIESFMRISSEQFRIAMNHMAEMAKEADDSLNRMAVDDCKELLNYAIDELQESMSSVSECPLQSLMQKLVDLKNWLSAVITYSNTCMDGFSKPQLQNDIHSFLRTSTMQAGQALSVVTLIPQILTGLHIPITPSASSAGGEAMGGGTANPSFPFAGGAAMGGGNANPSFSSAAAAGNMAAAGNVNPSSGANMAGGNANSGGNMAGNLGANMAGGNANSGESMASSYANAGANMAGGNGPQFPVWMPKADRKLLMSRQGGGPGGGGGVNLQPNAVVAKDGSGQYTTITDALNAYKPDKNQSNRRHVIYVKAGVYDEYIMITKKQTNIFMYGDGPRKTVVTGSKCYRDGVSTFRTAPFSVVGSGFICKSMGFENTAGPDGHQAVALRVQSDMSAFYNCRMDGYQDTLYVHTHRQFYSNCVISGTVDFIFGDASAIIQDSTIIVRKPMDNQQNIITAHGRVHFAEPTGLVIQNCQIVAEDALEAKKTEIKSYLGRPWKPYSRTVIMESTVGDFIRPEGWMPWTGTIGLDTCYYAEYKNRGAGADTSRRVNWKGYHVLTNANEAMKFTVEPFIQGSQWLPATGTPYFVGLKSGQ